MTKQTPKRLDLTALTFSPYDEQPTDPTSDEVQTEGARKILKRWKANDGRDPSLSAALLQLIPTALAHLGAGATEEDVVDACMELLRIEQTMTPAVANYLSKVESDRETAVLASFSRLLDDNPYITPWQSTWIAPALTRMPAFKRVPGATNELLGSAESGTTIAHLNRCVQASPNRWRGTTL